MKHSISKLDTKNNSRKGRKTKRSWINVKMDKCASSVRFSHELFLSHFLHIKGSKTGWNNLWRWSILLFKVEVFLECTRVPQKLKHPINFDVYLVNFVALSECIDFTYAPASFSIAWKLRETFHENTCARKIVILLQKWFEPRIVKGS